MTGCREGLKSQEKLVMSFLDGPFHRDHLKRAQLITRSFSQFCANIFLHNLFCIVMTVSFFQRSFNPKAFLNFFVLHLQHILNWWLAGINEQFGDLFKGQLISKYLFGVFSFLQKTNENKSTWGIIVVKSNSFVHFLEETLSWKNHFEFVWPLTHLDF